MKDLDITQTSLTTKSFESVADFSVLWNKVDLITLPHKKNSRYVAGFANSDRCVDRALRLRYEVFNLELNEGLDESAVTGLDRDEYDDQMTHLVLLEPSSMTIVGTYRIQTMVHAQKHCGLYSAQEYDLSPLDLYFDQTLELGRACLAMEHRTFRAIMTIWLGIGAYMNMYAQRYLFGCSSLTSQDPDDGWRAMKTIREEGYLHSDLMLQALDEYNCGTVSREFDADLGDAVALPKLFRTYLRLGSKVISEPAIDREFGTVDFLVFQDVQAIALSKLDVLK